ncbi:aminoacyl-tRNA hydrolase [Neoehrlichia mikurensis]|uniref:Peptidyl-tRNA hydrolase n=1 Tax=Neoehrlichia mikurensis TaxID=89586 RepID=A0A9Q9C1E7_9RICK|nr:aminoacyl-tRNA hydrolase [Neoehrlichia mikurensis]QXK92253.1 aminoacyl-tRNA hydrolase [Neoehrlichia mikurensis]QXK93223.1 aminoacyl-tRNA hydrolase [Neoehrlichia mikurensis]QXK94071.1 aminoacyl-tRNA hydrolase [Neoehrlichia mikurensis]UTO55890.1 aminoacyl-tRNA hydrolase [Neoehrlichia mikurensis]UTO56806.1 aminoacyl-tRNA hydrolase [Neoehrlichia mikurensis]
MFTLFVGLGNPGIKYELTRHNIGFMIIDAIANCFGFPQFYKKYDSLLSIGDIRSHRVILSKPQTFMNNSGKSIVKIVTTHKIALDNIIIFHDEADIQFGKIKLKKGGGSAGHNGLQSITQEIGQDYWRVRFGISKPVYPITLEYHVLSNFDNINKVKNIIHNISQHIHLLLTDDKSQFIQSLSI